MTTISVLLIFLAVLITLLAAGIAGELRHLTNQLERVNNLMVALLPKLDKLIDRGTT